MTFENNECSHKNKNSWSFEDISRVERKTSVSQMVVFPQT